MARVGSPLLLLMCVMPALGQPFSFGVKAGVPFQDALKPIASGQTLKMHRWMLGPTMEIKLPARLSFGLDALYRSYDSSTSQTVLGVTFLTNSKTGHWEFPMYMRYRLRGEVIRPFVNAGVTVSYASVADTTGCTGSTLLCETLAPAVSAIGSTAWTAWGSGFMAGGGVEFKLGFLKIAPEARYTHWVTGILATNVTNVSAARPNQADFLLGITF